MRLERAIVMAALAAAACKGSSEKKPAPKGPTDPTKVTAADAEAGKDLAEKMRHCPVTLPGVDAALADVDGGVRFTLLAKQADDAAVIAEVRARAHRLVERVNGRAQGGGGGGGGFMRNCPVITKDARIEATDVAGGVTITASPTDASTLTAFRATTRERMERAAIERATVVREDVSDAGETRLFAGGVADLDGDGTLELIAGGFATTTGGRRLTLRAYHRDGARWDVVAEAGWDGGAGSLIRNVALADVDGDARPEVIVLGRVGATPHDAQARLAVFGLDGGALAKRAEIDWASATYTHGYGLAVGDLDRDGVPEIVTGGFQFDGTTELGFVRVWALRGGALALRAETTLDGQGAPAMRVNDLAIGDVDGDGTPDLVVAGRHGPLKTVHSKDLSKRREAGDLSVLAFARDQLTIRARHAWTKGTSMRLRSVVVTDVDGDHRDDIVAGGQYDADGKVALALFAFTDDQLSLRDDASSTAAGVTGEIKDLLVVPHAGATRILATGVSGEKPGRQGAVAAWRVTGGHLVRDAALVSRNADETRARAVVLVPGPTATDAPSILTIGHARNDATMIGQVLAWQLDPSPPAPR